MKTTTQSVVCGKYGLLGSLSEDLFFTVLNFLDAPDLLQLEAACHWTLSLCRRQCVWHAACEIKYQPSGLNIQAYQGNYRQLYLDRNGWFPCRRVLCSPVAGVENITPPVSNSQEETDEGCVAVRTESEQDEEAEHGAFCGLLSGRSRKRKISFPDEKTHRSSHYGRWKRVSPKFHTTKIRLNPPLINTMDIKHDDREILIATEGVGSGSDKVAMIRVLDAHDYSLKATRPIKTRSINCLDASDDIFACGDDNGVVRVFGREQNRLLFTKFESKFRGIDSMQSYGLPVSREVNDLRLCRNNVVISVRTASRYPAGLQLLDLNSERIADVPPERTKSNWVHAIDVDVEDRSLSNVVAVGEKVSSSSFTVMKLDFRTEEIVVGQIDQTKRMLWPLRISGSKVFVNSVFGADQKLGRIRQYDWRYPNTDILNGYHPLEKECTRPSTICTPCRNSMAHVFPIEKVEDFRARDDYLYVLSDRNSELCLWRFDSRYKSEPEKLAAVDVFEAQEWPEPLRMLAVHKHGWSCTYGSDAKFGRIGRVEDREAHEEMLLQPLDV